MKQLTVIALFLSFAALSPVMAAPAGTVTPHKAAPAAFHAGPLPAPVFVAAAGHVILAFAPDDSLTINNRDGSLAAYFVIKDGFYRSSVRPIFPPAVLRQTTPALPAVNVVGLSMPYTDDSGVVYGSSVWIPATITIDVVDGRASVSWYCYRDSAALQAHKATVAQHMTQIDTPTFLAGSGQSVSGSPSIAQVIAGLATTFGLTIKDTPAFNADGTPQKDANGVAVMQPFFLNASVVSVSVTPAQ